MEQSLVHRIRMSIDFGVVVWVGMLSTLSAVACNTLLRLIRHMPLTVREEAEALFPTYEVMRARLLDSLQETYRKDRQLNEAQEELRISKDFLQTIIDSLDEELLVLDPQLRIVQANRSIRLKHEHKQIIGDYCYNVTHGGGWPCEEYGWPCPARNVWQTGQPNRVVHRRSGNGEVVNDEDRYIEVSASPVYDIGGSISHVVELIRDVTEAKEREKEILRANRSLHALNTICAVVSGSLSLDVVLNSALDEALRLTDEKTGEIILFERKFEAHSWYASRGIPEQLVQIRQIREAVCDYAVRHGEAVIIEDISNDTRFNLPTTGTISRGAFIGVPLKSKGGVMGIVAIASKEPRSFSAEQTQLLNTLGSQLGIIIENARLYRDLELRDEVRGKLLRQVISAQEDERQRVARDLHDVISQILGTLSVKLQDLDIREGSDNERKDRVQEAKSLISDTSREVHRLIHDLRPALLDDLGLMAAVRSLAKESLKAAGIEVHVEEVGTEKRLPPEVEVAIFRIVQEAIANIAKHAKAESAFISLDFKEKSISVQVEDDGVGFDLSDSLDEPSEKGGMGLPGMKERAELLGGGLAIDSKPGKGTRLALHIPLDEDKGV